MQSNDEGMPGRRCFQRVELAAMDFDGRYRMLTGAVIPRPIAFVASVDPDGGTNLAPFSSFMILSVEEGLLGFSVGPGGYGPKRTLANIRRHPEYVINTVSEGLAAPVQLCGEWQGDGVDKASLAGLALLMGEAVRACRVAAAPIHFECRLHGITTFGERHLVAGRIVAMHVAAGLLQGRHIEPLAYAPLGRIAGRNYCRVREIITA